MIVNSMDRTIIIKIFGLRDMARIDLMLTSRGKPQFLEINTIPGLTETSLLPMSASKRGISFNSLVRQMIMNAAKRAETGSVQ